MNNILDYLENTQRNYPQCIAVDDGSIAMTWTELLGLSRCIGSALAKQTKRGDAVAILLEKSAWTLAAMFGVVYAGCFYTMIDPAQPPERLKKILGVLHPALVITDEAGQIRVEAADEEVESCLLKNVFQANVDGERLRQIRVRSKDSDLLYGIFTSGSTGTPKGIVVSHRAVIDFITHFSKQFAFTADDRIGNQAPFDFDVSVKDIYTSVMTGARLILIRKELFCTPPRLLDFLCEKEVTTLIWAVSALTLVSCLKGLRYRVPEKVRRVMFSGEVMPIKQLRAWQEALPQAEFVNLYGPSEITCNCTYYPVKRIFQDGEKLPIGKAFEGRQVFLLDEERKCITESGKTGEICVAGESLSEGYYHNPTETDAKFISYFIEGKSKRCYCTGDLGYYGEDGELYFSGRKDFQIKHMGHRIELEEVEQAINRIQGVEKSCCFMDGERNWLVAYYLGDVSADEVRRQLKYQVPVYMIPQKLIQTSQIPLTKNGKTDREYLRRKLRATA